jgi:DNA repair exonuclease SbcCD ATPase subunit
MRRTLSIPLAFAIATLVLPGFAQHHASLTAAEVTELRDAAQEPNDRLKLYLKFLHERIATLEQIRTDPKVTDRPGQIHDHLQDFLELYDELNDNIDTYADRKDDIRKPLKAVIEADPEFLQKINQYQSELEGDKAETKSYAFVLSNIVDELKSSAEDHRKLMQEQEEAAKHKKKKKHESE